MDLLTSFLLTHSYNHAGNVSGLASSLTDRVFGSLSEAQMRARPVKGVNSLIWLLWHMARTEDVGVNLVMTAGTQVLDDEWARRMNVEYRHIGTGMTDDEVTDLTEHADIEGVRAYRSAVGHRTRDVARAFRPEAWDDLVGADDIVRAAATGAFRDYRPDHKYPWEGSSRWQRLMSSAAGHNILHHGEAITIRSLGGFGIDL